MADRALIEELRNLVGHAGVLVGPDAEPMLTDWRGVYRGRAVAVVRPGFTEEVSAVMAWADANDVVVVPQGGNTGLSGAATPHAGSKPPGHEGDGDGRPCIVLSLVRLNRVVELDPDGWTMTVEAGVTVEAAQEAAAGIGRLFAPDWGARGTATIGGAVATNAGGMNVVRYGTMRDQILGLEVVLADGRIWNALRALRKDSSGYDLKHLFIGSEGTLGVVTRAVVRLHPPIGHSLSAMAALPGLDRLMPLFALARSSTADALTTFELMPESAIRRVCRQYEVAHPFPDGAADPTRHYALIKLASDRPVTERLTELLARAADDDLISDAVVATTSSQEDRLWFIRDHLSASAIHPLHGHGLKMDTAVPISAMARFLDTVHAIAAEIVPGAVIYGFGHVGDGNIHLYILPADESAIDRFQAVKAELTARIDRVTFDLAGTLSAEHGIGQELRTRVGPQKSPAEWELMRQVKGLLDPDNRMNPGKLLPPGKF
jgi:FAD/FMN-containing dehydrogenase